MARMILAVILNVSAWTLIIGAIPGMIFTAVGANVLYPIIYKIVRITVFKRYLKRKDSTKEMGRAYDII